MVRTLDGSQFIWSRYYALTDQRGFLFSMTANWTTEIKKFHELTIPGIVATENSRHGGGDTILVDRKDVLIVVCLWRGSCSVTIATADGNVRDYIEWCKSLIPETVPRTGFQTIKFWTLGTQGPSSTMRTIEVPTWASVRPNYAANVQEAMDKIVQDEYRPPESGRLILWRGIPGTGKTFAIRALMQEWAAWASFHYIVDPDKFFGSAPEYMMSVILEDDDDDEIGSQSPGRWRVLILEDSGELLAADAKVNTGQGLSRLLNLVDGFVGQGLKVLVLVTTNEELGKLHPAVSRAGRALMNLEFRMLSDLEIAIWIKAHLSTFGFESGKLSGRLADLYAALNGENPAPLESVGFTP